MKWVSARHFLLPLLISLSFVNLISCSAPPKQKLSALDHIRARGRIVMITQNSGSTYYLYREQPLGFEYELAVEFARYLGVDLAIRTPGWIEMFDILEKGQGDFIAAGLTIGPSRERRMDFSDPYLTVRQEVVVHHDNFNINSIVDLKGKTVHVRAGTSYQERLAAMLGEGVKMELVLIPDIPTEELIRRVADAEIEITVADSNIALLNRRYQPDIRIAFPVSAPQSLGWAVGKGNGELLEAMNEFFTRIRTDGTLEEIYNRYHEDRNNLNRFDLKAFHRKMETRFPHYRRMIKEAAKKHGFDWRLIAAVIYQESHFDPRARSHTGVRGLMQVTQSTAAEMGIDNRLDPEQSIEAGVRYLASLYERFDDIENEKDRLIFSLASYNIGYGHVRDAQKIVREHGRHPDSWSSMVETLPLLQRPEYYHETQFGYARGSEPVRYVENIMAYYDILKKKI
jgi:membrane-bound lytic murein transglycosylase F